MEFDVIDQPGRRPRILAATDLTSSSDRALDRATALAREWDGELVVLHVLQPDPVSVLASRRSGAPSWRSPPDPSVMAESRIRRDLRDPPADVSIIVQEGEPARVILDVAEREQCDLVVMGAGRADTPALLGDTVDQLVRRCPVSVLIVKTRPHEAYRHVLVGTDFTEESRHGLEVAMRAFPVASFTLMHAFEPPYQALTSDTQIARDFGEMEAAAMKTFLEESKISAADRARVQTIIEHGPPELMFRSYVEERGADLVVIGAYGRGLMFHLLVGGNALRIVNATPSDVLVVRARKLGRRDVGLAAPSD